MIKQIYKFEDKYCYLKYGVYSSGRKSIMLIDVNTDNRILNVTVDLDNVKLNKNNVLIKTYNENAGIFKLLYENNIIEAPIAKFAIGLNWCFECPLTETSHTRNS